MWNCISSGTLRFAYTDVTDSGKYLCGVYVTSHYTTSINFQVQVTLEVIQRFRGEYLAGVLYCLQLYTDWINFHNIVSKLFYYFLNEPGY